MFHHCPFLIVYELISSLIIVQLLEITKQFTLVELLHLISRLPSIYGSGDNLDPCIHYPVDSKPFNRHSSDAIRF